MYMYMYNVKFRPHNVMETLGCELLTAPIVYSY